MTLSSLPRAVIFDWDNTLVDSWGTIIDAVNHTRSHFEMEPWSVAEAKAKISRSAREIFPEWFGARSDEAIEIFYKRIGVIQFDNLAPLNGAEALLQWLGKQSIPCCVVSNKNGVFLRREVEYLGWGHYFRSVVGATDAPRDKPAREHVDHALQLAGLKAGPGLLFVGDSEADMACAHNAECMPVLIGDHNSAKKLGVDLFVADCEALLALLSGVSRAIA